MCVYVPLEMQGKTNDAVSVLLHTVKLQIELQKPVKEKEDRRVEEKKAKSLKD